MHDLVCEQRRPGGYTAGVPHQGEDGVRLGLDFDAKGDGGLHDDLQRLAEEYEVRRPNSVSRWRRDVGRPAHGLLSIGLRQTDASRRTAPRMRTILPGW